MDGTGNLAESANRVVRSQPGRTRQMNAGAAHTDGDVLWFVHADTTIEAHALVQLRAALADPCVVGGGPSLRFDRRTRLLAAGDTTALGVGKQLVTERLFTARLADGTLPAAYHCAI